MCVCVCVCVRPDATVVVDGPLKPVIYIILCVCVRACVRACARACVCVCVCVCVFVGLDNCIFRLDKACRYC